MAKRKPEDPPAGSPAWMATFSDLMNLLLCFFCHVVFHVFDRCNQVERNGSSHVEQHSVFSMPDPQQSVKEYPDQQRRQPVE